MEPLRWEDVNGVVSAASSEQRTVDVEFPGVFHACQIIGDGNCFYRAISMAVFAKKKFYPVLRVIFALALKKVIPSTKSKTAT